MSWFCPWSKRWNTGAASASWRHKKDNHFWQNFNSGCKSGGRPVRTKLVLHVHLYVLMITNILIGTLTFAAECLTDSDSEAEVVSSEVASACKRTCQALVKTCFWSEDHQHQQVLKNCQWSFWRFWDRKFWWTSPSLCRFCFWSSAWRFWRQKFWWTSPAFKTWRFRRPSP